MTSSPEEVNPEEDANSAGDLNPAEVLELVHRADHELQRTLSKMLAPKARREGGEEHREQLRQLLAVASPHHVRDVMLHRMRMEKMYVGRGLSFMGSIVAKTEVGRLGGRLPGWPLSNKQRAFEFIDGLGVRRPGTPGAPKPFEELKLTPGTVVKPARGSGSLGCYLIFAEDGIVHVKDGKQLSSREEMDEHARRVLRDKSSATSASQDLWSVEELVMHDAAAHQPAIDLKFWTFYGKVAFISEINRHPETRWDFWTPDGLRIDPPGRWKATRYEGVGVTPEQVELVERISLEIPYPFMRIDMLLGEGELVFGEFTPRPGSSNVLTPEWDRRMGEMWGLAENRLQQDLLAGKEFSAYKAFMRSRRRRKKSRAKAQATKKALQKTA